MTTEEMSALPDSVLDQQIQLNSRVTIRTKAKLDAYIQYMDRPETDRPSETHDWPHTIQGTLEQALIEFLAKRPLRDKSGPAKKPTRTVKKGTRKASTSKE